ncbi:hypothetical protein H8D85_01935 [bacterium]|nr:hypothetical protein [bacterium]
MIERVTYEDKLYHVIAKLLKHTVTNQASLRESYGADLVLANKEQYWILREIIDVEFKEIIGE